MVMPESGPCCAMSDVPFAARLSVNSAERPATATDAQVIIGYLLKA